MMAPTNPAHPRLRTLLFVPGDRPDRIPKAAAAGADGIAIDLEDAVALSRKDAARRSVAEALGSLPPGGPVVTVRINAVDTGLAEADVGAGAARGGGGRGGW